MARRDWKKAFENERAAKRIFSNHLMRLVTAGQAVAMTQPAGHAKTQEEADLWERFYVALHESPVVEWEGARS